MTNLELSIPKQNRLRWRSSGAREPVGPRLRRRAGAPYRMLIFYRFLEAVALLQSENFTHSRRQAADSALH